MLKPEFLTSKEKILQINSRTLHDEHCEKVKLIFVQKRLPKNVAKEAVLKNNRNIG